MSRSCFNIKTVFPCLERFNYIFILEWPPGPWFNIKMSSYQYRESHCGDKTILRPSYLHNGISYAGKMRSLYWIGAVITFWVNAQGPVLFPHLHLKDIVLVLNCGISYLLISEIPEFTSIYSLFVKIYHIFPSYQPFFISIFCLRTSFIQSYYHMIWQILC